MTDHDRLTQLRVLLERLERMPASPDRDWMLAEVRSRAVDIDTGIAPRPMRPLEGGMTLEAEATPARPAAPPAKKKPQPQAQPRPQVRAPAPRRAPAPAPRPATIIQSPSWEVTIPTPGSRDDRIDLLALDGLLSLGDDAPASESGEGDPRAARPWSGGLRG
jgi:hypothetical protein